MMEIVIKDIGKMVNNMEMGNSYMMIEKVGKKEFGMKERELVGQKIKKINFNLNVFFIIEKVLYKFVK